MEHEDLFRRLAFLAVQKPLSGCKASCCLVTPINVKGSLPSHRYARMIVMQTDHPAAHTAANPCPGEGYISEGTVGGGPAELMCHRIGLEIIRSGIPETRVFNLDSNLNQDTIVSESSSSETGSVVKEIITGAVCGGVMRCLFEPIGFADSQMAQTQQQLFDAVVTRLNGGNNVVEWTALEDWTTAQMTQKAFVCDGSEEGFVGTLRSELRQFVVAESDYAFKKVRQKIVKCPTTGTELTAYPLLVPPTLFILGGGHVGKELCPIARAGNFKVVVVDDRPDFATATRHPSADGVQVAHAGGWEKTIAALPTTANSYIVILTHGHKGDLDCLKGALRTPAKYIGCIGSARKKAYVLEQLHSAGFTEEDTDRIHNPIGLNIGGDTPGEIAVGIAAELIQTRYLGRKKHEWTN
eukprot:GCRY01002932.1.p1 GENE.GCRY01002932.1~~GCRY01002932.1.p1  ORF type:complete len:463 (+),score=111.03 GCRY01002932.1:161-1390(+)